MVYRKLSQKTARLAINTDKAKHVVFHTNRTILNYDSFDITLANRTQDTSRHLNIWWLLLTITSIGDTK